MSIDISTGIVWYKVVSEKYVKKKHIKTKRFSTRSRNIHHVYSLMSGKVSAYHGMT